MTAKINLLKPQISQHNINLGQLISFAVVIVGFIFQMLPFLKVILSNCVKSYIVEIFTQPTEFFQRCKLIGF